MRRFLTAGLLLFVVSFAAFELSVNGVWATDHATSFIQLDYALWHDHSVALTSATAVPPWSVDDFVYGGQNYSALAPGTAFLALPFAGLGFTLAGGYTAYGVVLLTSETFVALTGAVAAYLVYALAKLFFRRSTSLLLGFAFAFSTIEWPMATYFFQSDVSAMFVLLAAYLGVRAVRADGEAKGIAALAGLAAGAAFTVDYVNGILIPILIAFIIMGKRGKAPVFGPAAAFVLGAVPGFAAIGAYNFAIFGSPIVSTEASYLHTSSVLGSFSTFPVYGLSLDLVSFSRGLLIYTPFLALGIVGYMEALRSGAVKSEMYLFLAIFLGILVPYSMWYDPYGGLSFGPRFLAAGIPFLLLPAGYVIERASGWKTWLVYALYLPGVTMNGMAGLVSAIPVAACGDVSPCFNASPFLSVVLPGFLRGDFDTWWAGATGSPLLWGTLMIVALAVVVPVASVELVKRRERGTSPLR